MNQSGFPFAVQAPPFGPFSREAAGKGYLQAPLHKSLFDTNHGAATDGESLGNLPIGTGRALALITHQEHPCYHVVFAWRPAGIRHRREPPALLLIQSHGIAVLIGSVFSSVRVLWMG